MCPSELGHRASSNSHPLFPISPDTFQGPNIALSMKRLLFKRDFFFLIYVCIHFWLCWVFAAVHRHSLVTVRGASLVEHRLQVHGLQ